MVREIDNVYPLKPGVSIRLFEGDKNIDVLGPELKKLFYPNKVLALMRQVHGTKGAVVTGGQQFQIIDNVDIISTNQSDVVIAVQSADCVPVLLYDPQNNTVLACHAGNVGIRKEIVAKAVQWIVTNHGGSPEKIHAWIGPAIGICCYNIVKSNDGRIEFFEKKYPKGVVQKKNGKVLLDLKKAVEYDLIDCGIDRAYISVSDVCTCSNKLPSHYRATYIEKKVREKTLITTIERNA